jgi:hypothetical protein
MWYVSDSPALLGALQSAELFMLVVDLEAFQDVIRGEKLHSRVTRQSSATILSKLLKRKIEVSKTELKPDEIRKGDRVILLLPGEIKRKGEAKGEMTIGLFMALV